MHLCVLASAVLRSSVAVHKNETLCGLLGEQIFIGGPRAYLMVAPVAHLFQVAQRVYAWVCVLIHFQIAWQVFVCVCVRLQGRARGAAGAGGSGTVEDDILRNLSGLRPDRRGG